MRIILLRHCEGLHNVIPENHSIADPVLTSLGRSQATSIPKSYPNLFKSLSISPSTNLILTSPFSRTIETTLLAFSSFLPPATESIPITILPQLQECGSEPCDTGSSLSSKKQNYDEKFLNWEELEKDPSWNSNQGFYEASDVKQLERGDWIRNYLRNLEKRVEGKPAVVICVSHHGFLRAILKLQKGAVWNNGEAREYKFVDDSSDLLVRIDEAVL